MKSTNNTRNTAEMVTISRTEYESLRDEKAELQQINKWLMEQLRLIRKNRFVSKSDTASEEVAEQMSLLFDEAEITQQPDAVEAEKPVTVASHTRAKKSGALKDILPANVPVEVEEHRLSGEELQCEICGSEMAEIGKTVRQTMKFIPAQVVIHEDWYYTYACKSCAKETDEAQIKRTPKDISVLPGSFASPEAVAHIMTQKYVMGVPLYRQEADLHRRGIELTRQTMSNWVIKCAVRWLTPVYEALHRKLLQEDVIHADETELQVLHEVGKTPQSRSYMWLYRSGKHAEHPIVLYEYQSNHRQENPVRFLDGFTGYLQTDGYSGYNAVQNVTHVGCLAHVRRHFTDAEKAAPKGSKSPTTTTAIAYCNRVFELEKRFAALSHEERLKKRREQVKPVLDEFMGWVQTRIASPKSKLGGALVYCQNQLPKVQNYLLDARLECSNNLAERSIKPFVIDRKNFLFANTAGGATSSAVTFSIIETAKENGLDPFRYLTFIFKTAPGLKQDDPDWIATLLPVNAPPDCRV